MYNKKIIGQRINSLLALKGKKQKELAEYLGVKDNIISYYVKGERSPNTEQIIKISKYFDVSTDYILGLSDTSSTDPSIKSIVDYTGLNENTISVLNKTINTFKNYDSECEKICRENDYQKLPYCSVDYHKYSYMTNICNYIMKFFDVINFLINNNNIMMFCDYFYYCSDNMNSNKKEEKSNETRNLFKNEKWYKEKEEWLNKQEFHNFFNTEEYYNEDEYARNRYVLETILNDIIKDFHNICANNDLPLYTLEWIKYINNVEEREYRWIKKTDKNTKKGGETNGEHKEKRE